MHVLNQVCRIGIVLGTLGLFACAAHTPNDSPCAADANCEPAPSDAEFDKGAASVTLREHAEKAKECRTDDGPTGGTRVTVTFAPASGQATQVSVKGAPFAGTEVGACIAATFRTARVPPFSGLPVSVTKSVTID